MEWSYVRGTEYIIYENGDVVSPYGKVLSPWRETNTGYLLVRIRENNKPLCLRLHRLLAECFKENPNNKPFVRHLNDVKDDNRLDNLEWGDNPTNTQEGYDNGCYAFPSKNRYGIKATHKGTGEVKTFPSIRSCAEGLKLNRKNISAILKARKSNTYIYEFEYYEMPND